MPSMHVIRSPPVPAALAKSGSCPVNFIHLLNGADWVRVSRVRQGDTVYHSHG
jgi:hypothetical protein